MAFVSLAVFDHCFKNFALCADFMLSDRVFLRKVPLNDTELCPYVDVLIFYTWSRFFILRSYLISFVAKNSDKTEGLMSLDLVC